MIEDEEFMDAIHASNMKNAVKQSQAIDDLIQYASDTPPLSFNQGEIAARCLKTWGIE